GTDVGCGWYLVIRSRRLMMNDAFDEALERLRGTGTEVAGGIAPNHGPMGAEALVALGRDDAVVAWADRYRRNLDLMPASNAAITTQTWREGLGVIERIGDWVVFFRTQLAEASWRSVFTEWIGRLLRATPSASAHGIIRTAHALRALQHAETPLRIEEFGVALAYWWSYYRKLPGITRLSVSLDYGQALAQVPLFLRGQSRRGAPREVYLRVMAAHSDEFSAAVDRAAEPESVEMALSSLTEAGARLYLANAARQPPLLLPTAPLPPAPPFFFPSLPPRLPKPAPVHLWAKRPPAPAPHSPQKPPLH